MLGNQQARPRRAPGFEIGMRPCRIFERITLADGDLHRTVLDHLEHTRCARGALAGQVVIVEQGRAGDELRPALREDAEVHPGHRSTGIAIADDQPAPRGGFRSEEHTSELQSLMRISYAVFCLIKKKTTVTHYIR